METTTREDKREQVVAPGGTADQVMESARTLLMRFRVGQRASLPQFGVTAGVLRKSGSTSLTLENQVSRYAEKPGVEGMRKFSQICSVSGSVSEHQYAMVFLVVLWTPKTCLTSLEF